MFSCSTGEPGKWHSLPPSWVWLLLVFPSQLQPQTFLPLWLLLASSGQGTVLGQWQRCKDSQGWARRINDSPAQLFATPFTGPPDVACLFAPVSKISVVSKSASFYVVRP